MKKHSVLLWTVKRVRRRIPAILLMTGAYMGHSLFSVLFALGTRGVIDSAVAAQPQQFFRACLYQAGIIVSVLICLTVYRHLRERLNADL